MRYAILSDVHANRQALAAVLADIRSLGADQVLCLGDLAGYGPTPAEVLGAAHARIHHFVLGNHDAALAGKLDPACFQENARQALEWTRSRLNPKAVQFFRSLPMVLTGEGFRCVHGDFTDPAAFRYLFEAEDAAASWAATTEPMLFCGHSHVPALFVLGASGTPHALPPQDFQLEEKKRYIVNVGSVGLPRDGDPRASWVLYDATLRAVWFRRVAFDLDGYRADLEKAGLPPGPAADLAAIAAKPLRERVDFRPVQRQPGEKPPAIETKALVRELHRARRSARHWRLAGLLFLLLFTITAVGLAIVLPRWRAAAAGRLTEWIARDPSSLPEPAPGAEAFDSPDASGAVAINNRMHQWSLRLADPATQGAEAVPGEPSGGGTALRLRSNREAEIQLVSPPVRAAQGSRFVLSAEVRLEQWQRGWLALVLAEVQPDGSERVLEQKELKKTGTGRWETLKFTQAKAAGGLPRDARIRLELRGRFAGAVQIRDPSLKRCEP